MAITGHVSDLRAVAKRLRGVTVLHFDAHADLYEEYEGDRYSHACQFARIMEEGLGARLVKVGIRTLNRTRAGEVTRYSIDDRDAGLGRRRAAGGLRARLRIDKHGRLRPRVHTGISHREPGS